MRVTLFGASGLLGQELVRALDGEQVAPFSVEDADLRDHAHIQRIIRDSRPEWIILSAAYTDVDGCETNRELAFGVNCDGAINVARTAREVGCRLLFLSTDYVFDGTKGSPYETTDARNPKSVYGETKAKAEVGLLEALPEVLIARTAWLFGHAGKCFPGTILKLAENRPELSVVDDQRGTPTYTPDLAKALVALCRQNARGIVHVTNSGHCTWYEFAKDILQLSGHATKVKPVTTAEFPRPAHRPAYSVMSPVSLHAYGIEMPEWKDALRRYLEERPEIVGQKLTGA